MVLVSHGKEFVFLKTRKAAGTSTEMLLERFCALPGHVVSEATQTVMSRAGIIGRRLVSAPPEASSPSRRRSPDWYNHMPAHEVARLLGPERWSSYAKVSCVRNPFDRTLSMFHWRLQLGTREPEPARLPILFRQFVETDWPDDREVVMIDNRIVVDHFIRYESLKQDLAALARALALDIDLATMPHAKNMKDRRSLEASCEYYDKRSIDIVRKRLGWVFDNYEYPDEPTGQPVTLEQNA
jgi:hypothetical protein